MLALTADMLNLKKVEELGDEIPDRLWEFALWASTLTPLMPLVKTLTGAPDRTRVAGGGLLAYHRTAPPRPFQPGRGPSDHHDDPGEPGPNRIEGNPVRSLDWRGSRKPHPRRGPAPMASAPPGVPA